MSKGSNRRPETPGDYGKGHERIFGKRTAKSFQKGDRYSNGVKVERRNDSKDFEQITFSCLPHQVAWHRKEYGHLGAKWRKDGTCIVKDVAAQRRMFQAHGMYLKNDTQGGPGSARRHLEKEGKMDEKFMKMAYPEPPKRQKPNTGMSEDDARRILERAKHGQRLTG